MDESELTRKAIEELMRDMNEYKKESLPSERKKNPLGKPNKRFLGRTLNSALTHNKRQSDRNYKKCQRKLKELDERQRKRVYYEKYRNYRKEPRRRTNTQEVIGSSTSEDEKHIYKKSKKVKKKKKRKKHQISSSSSSSTSSCSSSDSDAGSSTSSSRSKHKYHGKEKYNDYFQAAANDTEFSYFVDPNMAYAAMAYNQMNHLLHQQQLAQHQFMKEQPNVSVEIPSDLSLSCPESESSINISLHTSSAEEDENGILTFNLSSDDEKSISNFEKNILINKRALQKFSLSNPEQDDNESVNSHISLESDKSQTEKPIAISEVCLLNTSSSDSELEIVEIYNILSNSTGNNNNMEVSQNAEDTENESKDESSNKEKKIIEKLREDNEITEDFDDSPNLDHDSVKDTIIWEPEAEEEDKISKNLIMVDLTDD